MELEKLVGVEPEVTEHLVWAFSFARKFIIFNSRTTFNYSRSWRNSKINTSCWTW